jgi:hypothetical protein
MMFFRLKILAAALLLAAPALAQGAAPLLKANDLAPGAAVANIGAGGITASLLASGAAAANLGFTPDGAIFTAKSYGACTWTSGGDVGPCVNAAIAAAAAAGGGEVRIPAGVFGVATAIVQPNSGVHLVGAGVGSARDNVSPGNFLGVTRLVWSGSAGATMADIEPTGAISGYSMDVTGITFDCASLADICLKISQVSHSKFDVGVAEPRSIGLWMTTQTIADAPGTQDNDVWVQSRSTSATYAPTGIFIDGNAAGNWNVSYNRFHRLFAWYALGDGVVFGNSDNNVIYDLSTQPNPGATGKSAVFANTGYTSPNGVATTWHAYDNVVIHSGAAISVLGTGAGAATTISVMYTDNTNSIPDPTYQSATSGFYGRMNQWFPKAANPSGLAIGDGAATNGGVSVGLGAVSASNFAAVAIGGAGNSVPGWGSVAAGGHNNTVTGLYAGTVGGDTNGVSGSYGLATGYQATDRGRFGSRVFASGAFAAQGDAQAADFTLRGTGSTASAFRLTADGAAAGSANCINIPNNTAASLKVDVMAFDHTTVSKNETWQNWTMLLTRGASAATTALVAASTPTPLTNGTLTGSAIAATADTTNGCLNISFTPPTSNTDKWNVVARVQSVEVQ